MRAGECGALSDEPSALLDAHGRARLGGRDRLAAQTLGVRGSFKSIAQLFRERIAFAFNASRFGLGVFSHGVELRQRRLGTILCGGGAFRVRRVRLGVPPGFVRQVTPVVAYVAEYVLDRLQDGARVGRLAPLQQLHDAVERQQVQIALRVKQERAARGFVVQVGRLAARGGDDLL